MTSDMIISEFRNLFYQCEFKKLLHSLAVANSALTRSQVHAAGLIKVQTLFEMHQASEAQKELQRLCHDTREDPANLYVEAKLAYQKENFELAGKIFQVMADQSDNIRDYFRASLGLANVYLSSSNTSKLKEVIDEMAEMTDMVELDDLLSWELLQANYWLKVEHKIQAARKLFLGVIEKATQKRWNYFIIKALYSLAQACKMQGQFEVLGVYLDLLRCYLKPGETVFLNYLVNEQFKEENFAVAEPLQLDLENRRLGVGGRWLSLHDKPLIFNFVECLYRAGGFVSKKNLAEYLWPKEPYKPRLHDPRIFDLARRVRSLIEFYEEQPVVLLSGRNGYKLSATYECDETSETVAQPQAANLA